MAWRRGDGNSDVHLKLVLICKGMDGYRTRVRRGLAWQTKGAGAELGQAGISPCPRPQAGAPWAGATALGCSPGTASLLSFRSLSSSSLARLDWARDVTPGVWGRQQGGVLAAGEFLHSSRNLRSQMMRVPAKSRGRCQALLAPAPPRPRALQPGAGVGPVLGRGSWTQQAPKPPHLASHKAAWDTHPARSYPHITHPLQAPGALQDAAQRSRLPRATPWWPTYATLCCLEGRASPGAHSEAPACCPGGSSFMWHPVPGWSSKGWVWHGRHSGNPFPLSQPATCCSLQEDKG